MRIYSKVGSVLLCLTLFGGLLAGCNDEPASSSSAAPISVSLPDSIPYVPDSLPEQSSQTEEVPPEEASSISVPEPEPQAKPAPEFTETPGAQQGGKAATVTVKTNVDATVNAILTTSGSSVSTAQFYDYFNRGKALDGAVAKKQLFNVGPDGKSASFDVPDLTKEHYVLLNAAENETNTWQGSVTVVKVFDPLLYTIEYTGTIDRKNDNGTNLVFSVPTSVPAKVYVLITPSYASAPTATQVVNGGAGYTGGMVASGVGTGNADKAPFVTLVEASRAQMAAGNYTAWFVAQNATHPTAPLSAVGKALFNV